MKSKIELDDSAFLLLKTTDTSEGKLIIKGLYCDQPGVVLMEIIQNDKEEKISFSFKNGATIYTHCVDNKITSGDLVGGN